MASFAAAANRVRGAIDGIVPIKGGRPPGSAGKFWSISANVHNLEGTAVGHRPAVARMHCENRSVGEANPRQQKRS